MIRYGYYLQLETKPELEKILYCMKKRIELLSKSNFSLIVVFLKKDYEDLLNYLKDKIII